MFNNFMTSNINFKGILVSKTNLANNTLALYNLTPDDKNFIKSLQKSIDLPKLYPNLTLHQYGIWNNVIRQGLGEYCNNETSTVLLTSNKTDVWTRKPPLTQSAPANTCRCVLLQRKKGLSERMENIHTGNPFFFYCYDRDLIN